MKGWRLLLHEIIFEAETPAGKLFDVVLLWTILLNVAVIMLESVPHLQVQHQAVFNGLEWLFTGIFTLEYMLRLWTVRRPLLYATSFFGLVDLLAILPTFIGLLFPGLQSLRIIRILRLLRGTGLFFTRTIHTPTEHMDLFVCRLDHILGCAVCARRRRVFGGCQLHGIIR